MYDHKQAWPGENSTAADLRSILMPAAGFSDGGDESLTDDYHWRG